VASVIPIQNLYYLFCYAWNRFEEGRSVEVGVTDCPDLLNLFARVIINGTRRLLRRGLDRGYVPLSEDTACLRGRVLFGETVQRMLFQQAIAHCTFDELQHDVLHNQILRATVDRIRHAEGLNRELNHELGQLLKAFEHVSPIAVTRSSFRRLQLHRNNGYYNLLMKVCELVHGALLPEEGTGRFRFEDVLRDERRMALVFEEFVRNFYRLEQQQYHVSRDRILWDLNTEPLPAAATNLLPTMETDITLRSGTRTVVIEAKYYRETLTRRYGKETLHSDNLYQLFAYLKNLEARGGPDTKAEGILVYPAVERALDLRYRIQGHGLSVRTLDLAAPWPEIHGELISLLQDRSATLLPDVATADRYQGTTEDYTG
jgi:5-methylcytosine-specific restriction enzyme subunit McrC